MRQRLGKFRLLGFIPVIAWLFIQLTMIGMWSTGVSASSALAGQSFVICTGDGLITVVFDADGNPVEGDEASTESCTWCTGFSTPPTLTDKSGPVAFILSLADFFYTIQTDAIWHPRATHDGFPIRAPPTKA